MFQTISDSRMLEFVVNNEVIATFDAVDELLPHLKGWHSAEKGQALANPPIFGAVRRKKWRI
jgi:hypothetical protein